MHTETHPDTLRSAPSLPPDVTTEDSLTAPQITLTELDDAIERLGVEVPCRSYDPEVFFAEAPADVEYAKSLSHILQTCLDPHGHNKNQNALKHPPSELQKCT